LGKQNKNIYLLIICPGVLFALLPLASLGDLLREGNIYILIRWELLTKQKKYILHIARKKETKSEML